MAVFLLDNLKKNGIFGQLYQDTGAFCRDFREISQRVNNDGKIKFDGMWGKKQENLEDQEKLRESKNWKIWKFWKFWKKKLPDINGPQATSYAVRFAVS